MNPERARKSNSQRVTSADVAAAAGVSRATVSYVLNGINERISEQTRTRVFAAAERLGYVPNAMASALRAGAPRSCCSRCRRGRSAPRWRSG